MTGRAVARGLVHLLVVWLGISVIAFTLVNLAPGDAAELALLRQTGEVPSREAVAALRREMGLDDPLAVRYGRWLGRTARGDLGSSYRSGESVATALSDRFPATLQLAAAGVIIGLLVSIPLGVIAAARRESLVDHGSRLLVLVGASLPAFWLGYLLMLLLAVQLGLLPVGGYGGWRHLVLPALTLGFGNAANLTRLTRSALLDELGEDYVRTARAKGVPGWLVLTRHALRNALNPLVTLTGIRFGRLLGQAAIVEVVFAWPGIGRYVVESIYDRDYPAIQGFVLYIGTVFVVINLLVDVAYTRLDPRVRLAAGAVGNRG